MNDRVYIVAKIDARLVKILRLIYVEQGKGAISKTVQEALEEYIARNDRLRQLYLKLIEK